MNGVELKKILNDIIDTAYGAKHPRIRKYKGFYVKISDKNRRSYHGMYYPADHHIELVNLGRDDTKLMVTAIHELAHHIDNCNRGETDHQREFYEVYKDLLYAGLDMGLFTVEGFESSTRDTSGHNKVLTLLHAYRPRPVPYKRGKIRFDVQHAYEKKDVLKTAGYHYDNILKTWFIEVDASKKDTQENFLKALKVNYQVRDAAKVTFRNPREPPKGKYRETK